MTPALLLNESSTSPMTVDSTASPSSYNVSSTLEVPSPARTPRRNRRSPLLRRSVRTPPLRLIGAEGSWLTVSDNIKSLTDNVKKWKIFDASGGASVSNIGYKDRRVHAAIREQEETGIAYAASMDFECDAVVDFADFLLESTDDEMTEVVFYTSGI
jgi:adenosylmethionine-8-amino-7-oxononanoate aminotransferase